MSHWTSNQRSLISQIQTRANAGFTRLFSRDSLSVSAVFISPSFIVGIWWVWSCPLRCGRKTTSIIRPKKECPNFLKKKKKSQKQTRSGHVTNATLAWCKQAIQQMSTLTCLVPLEFLVRLVPDCFAVFLQFEEPHLLPGSGANLDQLSTQQQELHVCVALQTCRKVTHKTSPIQNQSSGWRFPECTRPRCLSVL